MIIGSADTEAAADRWQRLFDPIKPRQSGEWQIGDGPTIRIAPAREEGIERVALIVRSLDDARTALDGIGVAAMQDGDELQVIAEPLAGLDLRLVGG